jgi:hypothetical protein
MRYSYQYAYKSPLNATVGRLCKADNYGNGGSGSIKEDLTITIWKVGPYHEFTQRDI